jgi:hypothetical protein
LTRVRAFAATGRGNGAIIINTGALPQVFLVAAAAPAKMSGYWISFLVLYVVKSSSVAADLVLFSVLRYYYLRKCIAAPARFHRCLVIPPLKRSVCHAGKKMFSDTTRK